MFCGSPKFENISYYILFLFKSVFNSTDAAKATLQKWSEHFGKVSGNSLGESFCIQRPRILLNCVSYVLTYQRSSLVHVVTCQRVLRTYMLTCQSVLLDFVLTCQRVLCAYVVTCQHVFLASMLIWERVLCANFFFFKSDCSIALS